VVGNKDDNIVGYGAMTAISVSSRMLGRAVSIIGIGAVALRRGSLR
jgi:hypothetical protein